MLAIGFLLRAVRLYDNRFDCGSGIHGDLNEFQARPWVQTQGMAGPRSFPLPALAHHLSKDSLRDGSGHRSAERYETCRLRYATNLKAIDAILVLV